MKKISLVISLIIGIVACSSNSLPSISTTEGDPGFMEDYSIFQPVMTKESGVKALRYVNEHFANHEYNAAKISSVDIFEPKFSCSIPGNVLTASRKFIESETKIALQRHQFIITTNDNAANAVELDMDVAGGLLDSATRKIHRIIPVSSAVTYAQSAPYAKNRPYTAVVFVGGKAVDSQSGLLVIGSYVVVSAEKFVGTLHDQTTFESALAPALRLSLANFVESK